MIQLKEQKNVYLSIFIILLLAFIKAQTSGILTYNLMLETSGKELAYSTMVINWISNFVTIIFYWLFYSLLIHLFAFLLDSQQKLSNFLIYSAYAYIIQVISATIIFFVYDYNNQNIIKLLLKTNNIDEILKICGIYWIKTMETFCYFAVLLFLVWTVKLVYKLNLYKSFVCVFSPLLLIEFSKYLMTF